MNWPRPRFTVRRAMLGVLIVAVALGLALPAVEVSREPGMHVHAWINPNGRPKTATGGPIRLASMAPTILQVELRPSPFWPRYRRCLLGRRWRDQPVCTPEPGRAAEACGSENKRVADLIGMDIIVPKWPPEIMAEGRKRYPDLFPAGSTSPSPLAGP